MRTYLRILGFAAPYKLRIALAILCMLVLSLTTAAYANLLGPMLEFLFTSEVKSLGSLRAFMPSSVNFDAALASLDRRQVLAFLPIVLIGVSLLKGLAAFGQQYVMGMVGQRMIADLRRTTFDHLLPSRPRTTRSAARAISSRGCPATSGRSTPPSRTRSPATSATASRSWS